MSSHIPAGRLKVGERSKSFHLKSLFDFIRSVGTNRILYAKHRHALQTKLCNLQGISECGEFINNLVEFGGDPVKVTVQDQLRNDKIRQNTTEFASKKAVSKPHLHLHTQVVDKVSRERQTVNWSQYCIDPTCGKSKQCL